MVIGTDYRYNCKPYDHDQDGPTIVLIKGCKLIKCNYRLKYGVQNVFKFNLIAPELTRKRLTGMLFFKLILNIIFPDLLFEHSYAQ